MIEENIKLPSDKKFGYTFSVIFTLISIYFLYISSFFPFVIFLCFSVSFLLITLIKSSYLYYLNKMWFKFGIYIGRFVSPVVIGIIFFALITPISILSKIFKRDELNLRRNIDKNSYWKIREVEVDKKSFERQY